MSTTAEGKQFADALKVKHWADAGLEDVVGNLNAIRSKFEISQRVYFIDGEAIPVDEAYRFLLNKWMEKKMQAKRKEQAVATHEDETLPASEERGKLLSQKKKKTRDRRITRER